MRTVVLLLSLSSDHEDILVALVGAFALVLVALVPVLMSMKRSRQSIDDLGDHMPPNGRKLYEMVEATDERTARTEQRLDRLDVLFMEHLAHHTEVKEV